MAFDIRNHRLLDPDMTELLVLAVGMVRELLAPEQLHIVATGDSVAIRSDGPAEVIAPDRAHSRAVADASGMLHVRPTLAGEYQVITGERRVAILANYFDAAESDIGITRTPVITTTTAPGSPGPALSSRETPATQEILLLALALTALMAETAIMAMRAAQRSTANV